MAKSKFSENSLRLKCKECKHSNYTTRKNKKLVERKLEFKKFCGWCKKHTLHRESRMGSG